MNEETIKLFNEKIEALYNSLMERPLRILSIFNNFFGENMVDMQGYWELDEFKSWINTSPVSDYIPSSSTIGVSSGDWDICKARSITGLPMDQVKQIINALTSNAVKYKIGDYVFNDITILVHFPHVRVTNEHDKFVDINHLWAKVRIMYDGTLRRHFTLNRSEYTMLHIRSHYMHSHVNKVPINDFTQFQTPCTGSGPINSTILALNRGYDEDVWNMFCLELSKYVSVESIAGKPYNYLEKLGTNDMEAEINRFVTYLRPCYHASVLPFDKMREFVKYFVSTKKLKFNFVNGSYSIGMSLVEFIVLISNEFIKWYNNQFNEGKLTSQFADLKRDGILKECVINNGKIYYEKGRRNIDHFRQYIGKKVCTFKGREITVDITDIAGAGNENKSIILDTRTALYILATILKVLNYRYGRSKAFHEGNQLGTEVRYL